MRTRIAVLAALALAPSARAQAPAADLQYAPMLPGGWSYAATAQGSQARFIDTNGALRLTVTCTRTSRQVSLATPYPAAVPAMTVWTSSASRTLPARHSTNQLIADLATYDGLLDAMAFSRGRFALLIPGSPSLVVPAWPELARVIEDCRR